MMLHDRAGSETEDEGAPRPKGRGPGPSRPSQFAAKPDPVRAVWHDGSDSQVAVVQEWVRRVGGSEVATEVKPDAVVVVRPSSAEPLHLRPGMFLVLTSTGWTVYSVEQFQAAYQPLPWALPIFDDGEVA